MALAFSNLDTNSATNGDFVFDAVTASVAITNNSVCFLLIVAAGDGNSIAIATPTATGLTFTQIASAAYGSRRIGKVYRAINISGSTQTGAITSEISATPGVHIAQEAMWTVVLATDIDTTTPNGTVATPEVGTGVTSEAAVITGTPDSGDAVLAFFAHTGGTSAMTLSGETDVSLVQLGSGTNVRRILTAYDLSPDPTPTASVSWTGAEDSWACAFIVNVGAGGAGANILRQMMAHHGG